MAVVINVVGKTSLKELQKVSGELDKMRRSAEKAAGGVGGAIQKTGDRIRTLGQGMADTGDKMTTGVTLPLLGAGAAVFTMSRRFNEGMANVASLIPGNTKRVAELKTGVSELAVEVGKSTGDLTTGLYQVVSAFGDSSDSMKILETNARAARAGLATTTDAINLTSAVTKGYGDTSAAAVQQASDLALMTVRLGQTTFPELAASIGKVTPLTSELGVSQEELFASMASLTGVTGGAAEVSTQLRGVMQGLMQPTGDMSKLYERLGVKSGKALLEQEGLQGTIAAITKEAKRTGKPLGKYLSSIEGQTAALALAGSQSGKYEDSLKAMNSAQGATAEAYSAMTEGVNKAGFELDQAREAALKAGRKFGDALAPALTDALQAAQPLIEGVTDLADRFAALDEEQQKNIIKWVALLAAMGPVMSITGRILKPIGSLTKGVGKAAGGVGKLGQAFGKNADDAPKWARRVATASKSVGRGIASAAKATARGAATAAKALASWIAAGAKWVASQLAQAAKALASMAATAAKFVAHYARMAAAALANAARMAASWVIAMGPVGWVIAGIVALVALIIANWDKVVRFTKRMAQNIAQWFRTARDWVVETARNLRDRVVGFVTNLKDRAVAIVKALVNGYVSYIKWWRDRVMQVVRWVRDRVVGFFTGMKDRALGIVRTLVRGYVDRFNSIVDFVRRLPGRIASAASGMWNGITSAFRSAINAIIRGWNSIEFRIPGFKVGPIGYDGFTLGVPDIPQLARGAIATGPTLAMIGEGRQDEAVIPLPTDWRSSGGPVGGATNHFNAPLIGKLVVPVHGGGDARSIARHVRREVEDALGDVLVEVAAGAGAA